MAVRNRALSLATGGLIAGSALALATDGFIQMDESASLQLNGSTHPHTVESVHLETESPPVIELPRAAGGGSVSLTYHDHWQAYQFISESELVLVGEAEYRFEPAKPINLKVKPKPKAFGWWESDLSIVLHSNGQIDYWDEGQDEEDLIISLALNYFMEE